MQNTSKIFLSIFLSLVFVIVVAVGFFAWRALTDMRSIPGHIVRRFRGESGAEQTVNDLAEDIRRTPSLAQLQTWSIETLARFQAGQTKTNGVSEDMPGFVLNVRLAREERPDFIKQQWGETNSWGEEDPEILVLLADDTHKPEAIAINWYLYGIAVGPPNYQLSFGAYLTNSPKDGIYVYHFYK